MKQTDTPRISIVLVNWNTREMTLRCLRSVRDHTTGCGSEVFVVDNGSTDGSVDKIRSEFPEVQVIQNDENTGFARAANQGILASRGDLVALLNTDTLLEDDVFDNAVTYMDANAHVAVLGGEVMDAGREPQTPGARFPGLFQLALLTMGLHRVAAPLPFRRAPFSQVAQVDVVSGCFMVVRKAAMGSVGLLDEGFFFYGEETDWCRRFRKFGWSLHRAWLGRVTHLGSGSAKKLDHHRDVLLTVGLVRCNWKRGGRLAGAAALGMLWVFNASRWLFWVARGALTGQPAHRQRAHHFHRILEDFGPVWAEATKEVAIPCS